ncbi:MAG: hypothetical protein ABJO67_03220 [Pseudoruegeria sp.]
MEIPKNLPDNILAANDFMTSNWPDMPLFSGVSAPNDVTQKVADFAETAVADIGDLASGPDNTLLAEALFGELPEVGSSAAGDLDQAMFLLLGLGKDPASAGGFEMPDILVVSEGDSENALPEGVMGAFVEGRDGEPGTIMIAESMMNPDTVPDGETLEGVVLEEVGEAVAVFVSDFLEDIDSDLSVAADIDIGDRIQTAVEGGDLADSSDDAAVEVLVRLNNEERIAKAAAEAAVFVDMPTDTTLVFDGTSAGTEAVVTLSAESAGIDGAYVAADLNSADVLTLANYLFNASMTANGTTTVDGRTHVWATGLQSALTSIHGGAVTMDEVRDLFRLMNPDDTSFNVDEVGMDGADGADGWLDRDSFGSASFSWSQIKAAIEGGIIRFQTDTNGSNTSTEAGTGDVQYTTIDFGRMETYTDPHNADITDMSLGDYMIDKYGTENADGTTDMSIYAVSVAMEEFFGADFSWQETVQYGGEAISIKELFLDHHLPRNDIELGGANGTTMLNIKSYHLDRFLSTGSQGQSMAVWRDWSDMDSGYRFVTLDESGLDHTRQIQEMGLTTDYTDPSTFNIDDGAEYIDDKIYGLGDSVNLFNNTEYDVTLVGNDFEQYADDAAVEIAEGGNALATVITKMETFGEGISELMEFADFNYPNNETGKQLFLEETETQAINNFVEEIENVPGVDLTAYGKLETYDDVLLVLQDWVSDGTNNLAAFIEQVTDNIPQIEDAFKAEQLMAELALAGTIVLGAGMGLGAIAGIASTASKITTTALHNAATPGLTKVSAGQFFAAASKGDVASTIGAVSTQIGYAIAQKGGWDSADAGIPNFAANLTSETGVAFQDLVDSSNSQAFVDSSLRFSDANFDYKKLMIDTFPELVKSFGTEVYRQGGAVVAEREIGSNLSDQDSYGEVKDMINAIKHEIDVLNEDTETTGIYYVMTAPRSHYSIGDTFFGDSAGRRFSEGEIIVRALVADVAEPGDSVGELAVLSEASWNVDNY